MSVVIRFPAAKGMIEVRSMRPAIKADLLLPSSIASRYVIIAVPIRLSALVSLAANAFLPKTMREMAVSQYVRGGFVKWGEKLRCGVIQSPVTIISLATSAYLPSSGRHSGLSPSVGSISTRPRTESLSHPGAFFKYSFNLYLVF